MNEHGGCTTVTSFYIVIVELVHYLQNIVDGNFHWILQRKKKITLEYIFLCLFKRTLLMNDMNSKAVGIFILQTFARVPCHFDSCVCVYVYASW